MSKGLSGPHLSPATSRRLPYPRSAPDVWRTVYGVDRNLLPLGPCGLAGEPTVGESLATGVSLCIFSGDKLLGGPQVGILVSEPALEEIPVLRMLAATADDVHQRAVALVDRLSPLQTLSLKVEPGTSRVGGGAAPDAEVKTWVIAVTFKTGSAEAILIALTQERVDLVDAADQLGPGEPGSSGELVLVLPARCLGGVFHHCGLAALAASGVGVEAPVAHLQDGQTVNVAVVMDPQWVEIRSTVLGALSSHPEARGAVVSALQDLEA